MDPFSLTAGIIGVLGVGGQLAGCLKKIETLKGAPKELRELNGEISDFYLVVKQVHGLCHQCSEDSGVSRDNGLRSPLARMKGKLLELEELVAFKLTKSGSTDRDIQVDRSRWLRLKPKVQKLREDLRCIILNISLLLITMILYVSTCLKLSTPLADSKDHLLRNLVYQHRQTTLLKVI